MGANGVTTSEDTTTGGPLALHSSAGLGAAVRAACPLRIRPGSSEGCCRWDDFLDGFASSWARRNDLPTEQQWRDARSDWQAGNTGWEAAQNAKLRERERAEKAAAKPLVWLGGRNYAEAGSELAIKYGRQKPGGA